ncbi:porin family protein [Mucilaginibacter lutimaris]|uniref:Porin family protein n=1 Tax=Mucilaginibacter lutimaris TaxID=931629 RepID=A0ABW2ZG44_9SPHI
MNFIKALLVSCLLLAGRGLYAQEKSVSFGFKAGAGIGTLWRATVQDVIVQESNKPLPSFSAGAYANLSLGSVTIQPAVYYSAKGGKTTEEVAVGDIIYRAYGNMRLSYIQVPVNVVYNIPAGRGSYFLGAGPYIATALKASFKPISVDDNDVNNWPTTKYELGSGDNNTITRFDYGVNMLAGYQFVNGITINAGYDVGFSNIKTETYLYRSTKTRAMLISVGYQLP